MTKIKDSKIDFSQPDIYTGIIKPNSFTDAQLNALPNPQDGWLAQVSDDNTLKRYNGTDWVDIAGVTPTRGVYQVVVGPNQVVKTVAEALLAGYNIIAVVEDTTDNAVVIHPGPLTNVRIDLFATWTVNQYLDFNYFASDLEINGSSTGRLYYPPMGGPRDLILMAPGRNLFLNNLLVINFAGASCPFPGAVTTGIVKANNIRYANNGTGQPFFMTGEKSFANNLELTTNGNGSGMMLKITGSAIANNVSVTGAHPSVVEDYIRIETQARLSNFVIVTQETGLVYNISNGGHIENGVISNSNSPPSQMNITFISSFADIHNVYSDVSDIIWGNFGNCSVSGLQNFGNTGSQTIGGNNNSITSSGLLTDLTFTGSRNIISSNQLYSHITFNVGSDYNVCIGNIINQAVTNNGANNEIANNPIV